MAKRGRQPRPTHLRALEGVREDRLNRDEPVPGDGVIVPPVELPAEAMEVWNRLAPDLIAKKVLTAWDVDAFAEFCRSVVLYNRAAVEVENAPLTFKSNGRVAASIHPAVRVMQTAHQMMRSTGQRFGLTPGDRAALKVDGGSKPTTGGERLLS